MFVSSKSAAADTGTPAATSATSVDVGSRDVVSRDGCVVYVGNTRSEASVLRELFAPFGVVQRVSTMRSPFAFVTMATRDDALAAVDSLNGRHVDDRVLHVSLKRTSPPPGM